MNKISSARRAVEIADSIQRLINVRLALVAHPSWKIVIGAHDRDATIIADAEFKADIATVDLILSPMMDTLESELKKLGFE